MKKNIVISLLVIIIIIQFIALKNKPSEDITIPTPNNSITNLSTFYLMNNPIDDYFSPKLNSKIEAEVRDTQEEYEKTWKKEYDKVIAIIRKKITYSQDKENLKNFEQSVQNLIKTATPVLETELSDSYKYPDNTENRSPGNSTYSTQHGINGQIYRDASMLLIPFLKDEYQYPSMPEK